MNEKMLASFFASNYAFYAATQGYPQGFVYPNYTNPHFTNYSSVMAKSSAFSHVTLNSHMEETEKPTDYLPKSESCQKTSKVSSAVKFSIARILGETSTTSTSTLETEDVEEDCCDVADDPTSDVIQDGSQYSWLHCTRYKPPKLQRVRKQESSKKRKLGRNPRVPFTQHQVAALEQKFFRTHYLSSMDVAELSSSLNLTETRVKIWFQNRRARERRERESRQRGGAIQKSQTGDKSWTISPPVISQPNSAMARMQDVLHAGHSAFKPVRLQNFKDT